jgi:hypothetical protein
MSSRILVKATAIGTLVLGAAALSGCASKSDSGGASAGATQSVTSVTSAAGGAAGATATSTSAAGGNGNSGDNGSGTSTQAAGGGAGDCTGGELSLKIDQGSSGMGHTGSVLVFTNTGSSTCTLSGYPGAEVTDDGDYNWASRMNATRVTGSVAVAAVSLSPGSSASAMLEWDVNPSPGSGDTPNAANCAGMAGGYLEITPPNTTATTKSDPPLNMCTELQVFPVVAGTSGQ